MAVVGCLGSPEPMQLLASLSLETPRVRDGDAIGVCVGNCQRRG